jgi:hypothetical protein
VTEYHIDKRGHRYIITSDGPAYVSPCCGATVTFHDYDLCCKACWHLVPSILSALPDIEEGGGDG